MFKTIHPKAHTLLHVTYLRWMKSFVMEFCFPKYIFGDVLCKIKAQGWWHHLNKCARDVCVWERERSWERASLREMRVRELLITMRMVFLWREIVALWHEQRREVVGVVTAHPLHDAECFHLSPLRHFDALDIPCRKDAGVVVCEPHSADPRYAWALQGLESVCAATLEVVVVAVLQILERHRVSALVVEFDAHLRVRSGA